MFTVVHSNGITLMTYISFVLKVLKDIPARAELVAMVTHLNLFDLHTQSRQNNQLTER